MTSQNVVLYIKLELKFLFFIAVMGSSRVISEHLKLNHPLGEAVFT